MSVDKILIGYIPLLYPSTTPGEYLGADQIPDFSISSEVHVRGVAWMADNQLTQVMPTFILEQAEAVFKHLEHWCEGDYSRFKLHAVQKDNGYAIALIPSVEKSIQRFRLARLAYHDEVIGSDNFKVYYQFLGTYCDSDRLASVLDKIPNQVYVGFVEMADMQGQLDGKVHKLGPFEFVYGDDKHLDHMFEATKA